MPLTIELVVLLLCAYTVGLGFGALVWGRNGNTSEEDDS